MLIRYALKEDSPDFDAAIKESLTAVSEPPSEQATSASTPPISAEANSQAEPMGQCINLDGMIHDMAVKLAMEVPTIYEPNADTWVFIDPPPRQPEQDDVSYLRYVEHYRTPKAMRSSTLLAVNSPFFEKAFGPTAQHRVLRRRGLVGKLPSQIKYVLDLTPPSEGDEAVYLTSELCCSDGVRKWAIAGKLWRISKTLIGGQEEYSSFKSKGMGASVQTTKMPLQYTPLRHRSAIERVLLALTGCDPQLDSAAKVWTACAVARYFEVIHSPFTDYVIRWLRAEPNSHFLEVLPEASIKIADGFECHNLCRDTFALLVGEEALGSLYRRRSGTSGLTTLHGRKKEDLPETYQTRVEYASKALIERVTGEFMAIVDMKWLELLPEIIKLSTIAPPSSGETVDSFKLLLGKYIRGAIGRVLCAEYSISPQVQPADIETNELFSVRNKTEVWNHLLTQERVLTRSFWDAFKYQNLFGGPTNMDISGTEPNTRPLSKPSVEESKLRLDKIIEEVHMSDLEVLAKEIQRSCQLNEDGSSSQSTNSLTLEAAQAINTAMDLATDLATDLEPRKLKGPLSHQPYDVEDRYHNDFSLFRVLCQADDYLCTIARRMLAPTDARTQTCPLSLSDILVSLEDSEFKYLPLWAGGCDDGSGGVYDNDVPVAASGFSHPGPNVHQGSGSSVASSEFEFIRGVNSHNTSTIMNDGSSMDTPSINDPFTDAEAVRAPSTVGDSENDLGSVASSVGTATEGLAHLDLDQDQTKSEKAKGKMPVRDDDLAAVAANLAAKEKESEMQEKLEQEKSVRPVADDDFEFIFGDGSDEEEEDVDDDNVDGGSDSDDTVGG